MILLVGALVTPHALSPHQKFKVYFEKGFGDLIQGNFKSARESFTNAIKVGENLPQLRDGICTCYLYRASTYLKSYESRPALADLDMISRLNPKFEHEDLKPFKVEARLQNAILSGGSLARVNKIIDELEQKAEHKPILRECLLRRAMYHIEKADYPCAQADVDKAIAIAKDKNNTDLIAYHYTIYCHMDQWPEMKGHQHACQDCDQKFVCSDGIHYLIESPA